ncbi:MAG TPA: hypothetical protein VGD50_08570 [Candidatus Baltobacteraceae bacterium]
MKRRRLLKQLIALVIISIAIWVGYEVYQAGLDEVQPTGPMSEVMGAGAGRGFRNISTPSWSFDYDKVIASPDNTVMDLYGVHNGVFYKDGKPNMRLRAKHIIANVSTHNFIVEGPLHIETIGGTRKRTLDTTAAVWDDGEKLLTLSKPTTVTTSGGDVPLVAGKITIDMRTGDVHIERISGHVSF